MVDLNRTPMVPENNDLRERGGHWLAGVLAVAVSVAIHSLLVLAASRIDFDFLSRSPYTRPERQYEAMQLGSVEVSTEARTKLMQTLRELGQAASPDVTRAVDDLQVAPEVGITDPPALDAVQLDPELEAITPPPLETSPERWEPRQEILAIEKTAVGDTLQGLERRPVPAIERVPDAPDIVLAVGREKIGQEQDEAFVLLPPTPDDVLDTRFSQPSGTTPVVQQPLPVTPVTERERFEETPDEIRDVKPVEQVLTASVEISASRRDRRDAYFRLTVERAGEALLPELPKDMLLVQDSSAGISDQRRLLGRESLRRALSFVGPADRFNVVNAADQPEFCFADWTAGTPEARRQADRFIREMTPAEGAGDLVGALKPGFTLEREPGRPVIALLLTDGGGAVALDDDLRRRIAGIARQRKGPLSVFVVGYMAQSNFHLLNLFSNWPGMNAEIVNTGRFEMVDVVERMMRELQRPVLSDLTFRFASDSEIEVYPQHVGHLYLDRPLKVYGRYPQTEDQLLIQVVGMAGKTQADMIFNLPLETPDSRQGDATIRDTYGLQKMHHLVGEYARSRDRAVQREIRDVSRTYGQPIPYREHLGL